jgi:hypothetical protein
MLTPVTITIVTIVSIRFIPDYPDPNIFRLLTS